MFARVQIYNKKYLFQRGTQNHLLLLIKLLELYKDNFQKILEI